MEGCRIQRKPERVGVRTARMGLETHQVLAERKRLGAPQVERSEHLRPVQPFWEAMEATRTAAMAAAVEAAAGMEVAAAAEQTRTQGAEEEARGMCIPTPRASS